MPELAGRLPIIVPLAPLTKEQMRRTLTEPKNSVIKQQIELFRRDGIELVFTDAALDAVVEKATMMKTGVRALRSLVKGMTSRARYDLPGDPSVTRVEIGPETLNDSAKVRRPRSDSSRRTRHAQAVSRVTNFTWGRSNRRFFGHNDAGTRRMETITPMRRERIRRVHARTGGHLHRSARKDR